jgi:hypothetical protein
MLGGDDVYRVIDKRVHRTEENSDNDNNGDEGDDDVSGDGDGNGHTFFLMRSRICKGVAPLLRIAITPQYRHYSRLD